ncbi:hypothetical protein ABFV62_29545, partial [Pseudomonas syringae]|uniref:hypothetical protein n=2 Tax=Pseudomonas TaxID=286 RepID=UPI0034D58B05
IRAEANSTNGATSTLSTEQQILSLRISQIRDGYLQILPDANNYFGVPAFFILSMNNDYAGLARAGGNTISHWR